MPYKPSKVFSGALIGLESQIVEVEADVSVGLNSFQIVGLPDKSVDEAKERISSALRNHEFKHPRSFNKRVVINLAPADLKKEGVMYDLPVAISFLLSSQQIRFNPSKFLFAGELSLEGNLRPVKNSLSLALLARDAGIEYLVIPAQNLKEAAIVEDIKILSPANLRQLVRLLENPGTAKARRLPHKIQKQNTYADIDMANISGQQNAKRALEIAAAGGHNVIMQGPPGSGKTILAKALAGILPDMTHKEMVEVTRIYSMVGKLNPDAPLIETRPFRSPHHSSSASAIVGGGSSLNPGEITLSHRGVLFMDEFPEFRRDVLEALRQPMESGSISVARAKGHVTFPANFILVAAANPCPCGFYNDPEKACECYGGALSRYRRKLSGPISDRIDIHIEVPHQQYEVLTSDKLGEASGEIRKRVESAREMQSARFADSNTITNAAMTIEETKKYCRIPEESENMLKKAVNKDRLSARGYHKILKIARTISDLENRDKIKSSDVAEAVGYNARY